LAVQIGIAKSGGGFRISQDHFATNDFSLKTADVISIRQHLQIALSQKMLSSKPHLTTKRFRMEHLLNNLNLWRSRTSSLYLAVLHRASFVMIFSVLIPVFAWMNTTFADEPAKREWKYDSKLLRPFWLGDTVEGESMLFIKDSTSAVAKASTLYPILKVLSVHNSAGDITYEEGRDYQWKPGTREITLTANSRIVARTPAELRRPDGSQKYRLTHRDGNGEIFFGAKLEYHHMQTCITYTHEPEDWKSITPKFDANALPRTIGRLRDRKPISIVLIGDSISSGCNASGWAGEAPFQPSFPGLLQRHLEVSYETTVRMVNPSVSGKDTRWVLSAIDQVIKPRPDLVIVAFGMNDAAGRSAEEYKANTKAVIEKIRQSLPNTEFILVATMLGNRDWPRLKQELFPQYRDALKELCEPGIALADMTSIWTKFLKRKQDWDLTGNGVNHPNDFGHRVYAQVLSTLLVPPLPEGPGQ
jgi:acyl-CoA thioesterase-1